MDREQRQQRPLHRRRDLDHNVVAHHPQRTKNPDLHAPKRTPIQQRQPAQNTQIPIENTLIAEPRRAALMRSLLEVLKIDARVRLMESREVVYDLLRLAILHIRAYAGPAERNYEMITALSYLIHNLPDQIEAAEREGASFDGLLATIWTNSSDRSLAHDWLAAQLNAFGFDISQVLAE